MADGPGRPVKYETVEELQAIIDAYFEECEPHPVTKWVQDEFRRSDGTKSWKLVKRKVLSDFKPPTMAGLAIRLGLSRQGLMEYKAKTEFSDAIKLARDRIGEYNEQQLTVGKNVTGAIFNLKVNWDYHENKEENPPPENPLQFIVNVPIDGPVTAQRQDPPPATEPQAE